MSRILRLALLAPLLFGGCERAPAPLPDRSLERGTALPPPGLAPPMRR